jgi:lipopolysaccharide/colanic/teichoic acid biosynthesis glycosyltransferase
MTQRHAATIREQWSRRWQQPESAPRKAAAGTGLAGEWYRTVRPRRKGYLRCKRALDILGAGLLLMLALPVMALAALLVRLTSRGPAIYSQVRTGKGGRLFTIYKLRTMVHNCESLTGPRWCLPGDPRITPVGAILRSCHLDELPQLWNVLRGDMSLIGPRPERPEFLPDLERALPHYRQRLHLRPGITGLAQIQLPPDSDLESVRRKLACDLFYVRETSLLLDLKILLATAGKLLQIPCAVTVALLRIPRLRDAERLMARLRASAPRKLAHRVA